MRWKKPATWLALASALLVTALVWLDSGSTSPGAISAVHAQSAELASDGCERCHGGADAPDMTAACSSCHAEIAEQIAAAHGFHGTLADATHCDACHSEHHGRDFRLVTPAVFALAGVADASAYDHARLGFELAGRHARLACADCHPNADVELLRAGERRLLGLSQSCASCHEDVHGGKLPDCAACHGQEHPFAEVAEFEHVASFALAGVHAGVACRACHPQGSDRSIEAERVAASSGSSESPARAPRACEDCHASPHAERFLVETALARGVAPGAACEACHPTAHGSFAEPVALAREEHAATGFALDGPHAALACSDCHVEAERADDAAERASFAAFRAAHPGRAADDCAACHGDPHGGQFAEGALGERCTTCHAKERFTPPEFDVSLHARTAFPLEGAHRGVDCRACHARAHPIELDGVAGSARVFHGTSTECAACHADAHRGAFDRPGLPARVGGDEGCARCHDESSFDRTKRAFDHALWAGFVLDGAHARAECSACHPAALERDDAGRSFGRASERFHGDLAACSTCHADAHDGAFDSAALPASVEGREGCARCHTTRSFADVAGFDHGRWTGFALVGAHARASCASCHAPSARPDARGRSFGRSAVRAADAAACTSCHADVHGGAFDRAPAPTLVDGRASCSRCHTQSSFADAREAFDHAQWTGFALDGAHAELACARCHEPAPTSDGRARVQSRARGASCADCHVDPHAAQFASGGTTDCARCHASGPDFTKLVFDHDRDARFALDATHAKLACVDCHRPAPLPDGTSAVRYKPLGTACADCHDPRAPRSNGGLPR